MAVKVLIFAVLLVWWERGQAHKIHPAPRLPHSLDPGTCPPTYEDHPLILISMDGFRAEYLTRGLTPTIEAMGKKGVRAPYMKPSFPTITFPNHYTLVTGLSPPYHGIIANKFYDPVFEAEFRVGRPTSFEKRWWGGEAIWNTVQKYGKKSATFFWPGSEANDNNGNYWFYYNESVPFENRVQQTLEWLDLPPEDRPSLITLYMHEPDSTGHDFGPKSTEIEEALIRVDATLKLLLEGLKARNILNCVNIVVVADHGMAAAGEDKTIFLDKYIPNLKDRTRFWKGAFVRIQPNDNSKTTKREMMESLSCKIPEMRVYEKTTLPIRWHMGAQRRVEDIVVDVDAGYSVGGDENFVADAGEHGYDNFFPVMNALFVAYGPEFRNNLEVEAFQNIELYNLLCHLVGVTPAPNNGTWGSLHHMLARPPPSPPHPGFETLPTIAGLPLLEGLDLEDYLKYGLCEGDKIDSGDTKEWMNLLAISQRNIRNLAADHLPWGMPALGWFKQNALLLPHQDFVTVFSPHLKYPVWTSFTIKGQEPGSRPRLWMSDIRLESQEMPSCIGYQALSASNISRYPLFHPQFSSCDRQGQMPYLISNALPLTSQLAHRWSQLMSIVRHWAIWYGPLNVIAGPVFDYNSDTFVDDLDLLSRSKGMKVPTHLFMVVTRCLIFANHLSECPHTHVDTLAFVFPQYLAVPNCLSGPRFAQEFMAKVQDVEKITGLKFFTNMGYDDRVRLGIRIHSNIWGRESWWNRLRTNFIGIGK